MVHPIKLVGYVLSGLPQRRQGLRGRVLHFCLRGSATAAVVVISVLAAMPTSARPGVLFASQPSAIINIRSRPTLGSAAIHLARPGDRITVVEEILGRDRMPWYFIQRDSDNAAGWVRGDLVTFSNAQGNSTVQGVPSDAVEACRNRAFVALDTFRSDIDITQARVVNPEQYDVRWQQQSTMLTGQCTVNVDNTVTEFAAIEIRTQPTQSEASQVTLHTFRTEDYSIRIYRADQADNAQTYINLWDIGRQSFVLQGDVLRTETAGDVTVFWLTKEDREYQVRVLPSDRFTVRISAGSAVEYEGNSV